jgi:hypothetical protein
MAIPNLQDLHFRLSRAGGDLVKPILFTRIGTGVIEGIANMFGYKTGKTDLLDKHKDFLHTLFTDVLKQDELSTVRFIGRADRRNRSGKDSVNQKVSDDRARNAENHLRVEFVINEIDSFGRISNIGNSDKLAIARGDAAQSDDEHERAVLVIFTFSP